MVIKGPGSEPNEIIRTASTKRAKNVKPAGDESVKESPKSPSNAAKYSKAASKFTNLNPLADAIAKRTSERYQGRSPDDKGTEIDTLG